MGESASPEYDDDDAADEEAGEGPLSSYKSRPPLERFLKSLMSNKFERVICSMVKSSGGSHRTLDLTSDEAKLIKTSPDEITALYLADFPVLPSTSKPGVVTHSTPHLDGAENNQAVLTVVTQEAPLTEEEYKLQLNEHQTSVAEFERMKLDAYVTNRVAIVTDTLTTNEGLKRKLQQVPLMAEKKRKLFVHDEMCANGGQSDVDSG